MKQLIFNNVRHFFQKTKLKPDLLIIHPVTEQALAAILKSRCRTMEYNGDSLLIKKLEQTIEVIRSYDVPEGYFGLAARWTIKYY